MRPLAILTGFVLGTSASITLSLAVVGLIFTVLAPEYEQVRAEIRPFLATAGLFLCLTVAAALSFVSMLRELRWRWLAQAAMWAIIAATVFYFLP
ncbi:MAG: hypothetical protein KJO54_02470 [Gammaproteobacteria bacterium]|nr:hypothetical protein [Gammaproteobacteria bacterium]NNF61960.1 hypothetical protein [Gammaproteobacteria bacterium]NNM21860.1 hypothetical protein [Gammaproteobacteria bacterium]